MTEQVDIPAAAQWITLADWRQVALPAHAPFVAVRREFVVPARPGRLECCVTASAGYTVWLDGELMASGPARSWPGRWLVDRHDLTRRLRPGRHQLAVLIHPPTGGKAYGVYLPLGLCAWVTAGRRGLLVATDGQWLTRSADWVRHHGLVSALPTGWQEHHQADSAWTTAAPDGEWKPATVLGPLGETPPWGAAARHALPPADEHLLETAPSWSGRIAYRATPEENLVRPFLAAKARRLENAVDADGGVWLDTRGRNCITVDAGRTRNLRPGCRVLKVEGPVRLDCLLDIALRERPTAGTGFGSEREGSVDSLTVAGPQTWWRAQPRGARFITWCASGRGRVLVKPLCRAVEHPYLERAEFACDDPFFQQLWEMTGETIRAATTDVLVDTCFRENALWTFDACATGLGAFYRFGDAGMAGHCFRLVADGVQENGTVPGIVPSEGEGMACMLLDQTLSWVHACRHYHELTGDDAWGRAVLPAMRRVLGLVSRHCHDGLLVPPSWSWHWVDWAAIDKRPFSAVINLLAWRAVQSTQALARHLGDADTVRALAPLAAKLARGCRRFWDAAAGGWRQHAPPAGGAAAALPRGAHDAPHDDTQPIILHTNGLALGLQLGTAAQRAQTAACCERLIAQPFNPANNCGPGWIADLLTPCCSAMDPALVRQFLAQTYGRCFLETGAPTFGERFEGDQFNTAHGWGASVITLLVEGLLGLKPAAPGWRAIQVAPRWPGTGDVSYTLRTPHGVIGLRRRHGHWQLRAPRGTQVQTPTGRWRCRTAAWTTLAS